MRRAPASCRTVDGTGAVDLGVLATRAWSNVDTGDATLENGLSTVVEGDPDRLLHGFENRFRNSVEHGSTESRSQTGDSVEHGSTDSRSQTGDSVEHGSTDSRPEADDAVEHGGSEGTVRVDPISRPAFEAGETVGSGFYVERATARPVGHPS